LRKGEKHGSIVCRGYGFPNPKATWKINNMDIPESSNSSVGSGVYQRRSTNDLVLQNVTSTLYFNQNGSTYEDFGNYTCEVTIEQAPETSSEIVKVICEYTEYSKLFCFPLKLLKYLEVFGIFELLNVSSVNLFLKF
jgi:hypothetical protein